ncbi:MAG: S1 RNA-binding domain-containing protein [Pirellulales bacterium]
MTDDPSQLEPSSNTVDTPPGENPIAADSDAQPAVQPAAQPAAQPVTDADAKPAVDPAAVESENATGQVARPDTPPPAARRTIKIGSQRTADSSAATMKPRPPAIQSKLAASAANESATAEQGTSMTVAPAAMPQLPEFTPPPPRLAARLSPELQAEIDSALGDLSMEEVLATSAPAVELEEGARVKVIVLSVRDDSVLADLNQQYQGFVSLKQFESPPEPGATLEVIVNRFDSDEGMYELHIAGAAVDVARWEELSEGIVVDAVVTGHNKGGLECEVNKLRGFIPASQVGLYRIDNLEEMVGQRFACVVTEVNPDKRNLVLSRRGVLERERTDAKQKLLQELKVGQTRDGVVRRLQPFGAFVDLGGVDGLVHISQLSWDRIDHPSEVLKEGQQIKVKINKINPETGKIGLAYRDTWENPWEKAAEKYQSKSTVQGTVTRLTDFGAFVKLEPGVEGLIHVSELAHHRVWRASDVLSEGQQVDVMVLSVDPDAQRISLSLKALQQPPAKKEDDSKGDDPSDTGQQSASSSTKPKRKTPLRGGVDRPSDGKNFGLQW